VCGLVAAAFGQRRHQSADAARRSNRELDALRGLLANLEAGVALSIALESLRRSFGLRRLAVRDASGHIVAASPADDMPAARTELDRETLEEGPAGRPTSGPRGARLPQGGGWIKLPVKDGPLALELWEGRPDGLSHNDRRALSVAAALLALELSRQTG
jgi:hypothetical protein